MVCDWDVPMDDIESVLETPQSTPTAPQSWHGSDDDFRQRSLHATGEDAFPKIFEDNIAPTTPSNKPSHRCTLEGSQAGFEHNRLTPGRRRHPPTKHRPDQCSGGWH